MARYPGSLIRATPLVPALNSASGVWTLKQAMQARAQGIWGRQSVVSFLQSTSSGTDLTTYTFSAQNLGTAVADRHIIVCVGWGNNSNNISSVTVGGVTATSVVAATGSPENFGRIQMFIAAVPSGATGDVVVTFASGENRCAIAMYRATFLVSASAHQTATDATATSGQCSANIDVPAGGFAIGFSYQFDDGTSAYAWTNLTEDSDFQAGGEGSRFSTASQSFSAAQSGLTVTATSSATTRVVMALASWV